MPITILAIQVQNAFLYLYISVDLYDQTRTFFKDNHEQLWNSFILVNGVILEFCFHPCEPSLSPNPINRVKFWTQHTKCGFQSCLHAFIQVRISSVVDLIILTQALGESTGGQMYFWFNPDKDRLPSATKSPCLFKQLQHSSVLLVTD